MDIIEHTVFTNEKNWKVTGGSKEQVSNRDFWIWTYLSQTLCGDHVVCDKIFFILSLPWSGLRYTSHSSSHELKNVYSPSIGAMNHPHINCPYWYPTPVGASNCCNISLALGSFGNLWSLYNASIARDRILGPSPEIIRPPGPSISWLSW